MGWSPHFCSTPPSQAEPPASCGAWPWGPCWRLRSWWAAPRSSQVRCTVRPPRGPWGPCSRAGEVGWEGEATGFLLQSTGGVCPADLNLSCYRCFKVTDEELCRPTQCSPTDRVCVSHTLLIFLRESLGCGEGSEQRRGVRGRGEGGYRRSVGSLRPIGQTLHSPSPGLEGLSPILNSSHWFPSPEVPVLRCPAPVDCQALE